MEYLATAVCARMRVQDLLVRWYASAQNISFHDGTILEWYLWLIR